MTPTPSQPSAPQPKARVTTTRWTKKKGYHGFAVLVPTATRKQAQQIVRWSNLSREQKVEAGARAMSCIPHGAHMTENWWKAYRRDYPAAWASAIISATAILNLIEGTK